MRKLLVALIVVCVFACSKKRPPPKNELEAFERDYEVELERRIEVNRRNGAKIAQADVDKAMKQGWAATFIGSSGVYVDHKLVATLGELDTKRAEIIEKIVANERALVPDWNPSVVLDIDAQPVSVARSALRLFEGREVLVNRREPPDPDSKLATRRICAPTGFAPTKPEPEVPTLSVYLAPARIWVGLSKLDEFQEIADVAGERDLGKLESTLKDHKASSLFEERSDIELAVETGTASDLLRVLELMCNVGFVAPVVLEPKELSAIPSL